MTDEEWRTSLKIIAQGGTTLKMFATKLAAMGDVATQMVNTELKRFNAVFTEDMMGGADKVATAGLSNLIGKTIDIDAIEELAKQDLDAVINVLSNLYNSGQLSFAAVSKMFG